MTSRQFRLLGLLCACSSEPSGGRVSVDASPEPSDVAIVGSGGGPAVSGGVGGTGGASAMGGGALGTGGSVGSGGAREDSGINAAVDSAVPDSKANPDVGKPDLVVHQDSVAAVADLALPTPDAFVSLCTYAGTGRAPAALGTAETISVYDESGKIACNVSRSCGAAGWHYDRSVIYLPGGGSIPPCPSDGGIDALDQPVDGGDDSHPSID